MQSGAETEQFGDSAISAAKYIPGITLITSMMYHEKVLLWLNRIRDATEGTGELTSKDIWAEEHLQADVKATIIMTLVVCVLLILVSKGYLSTKKCRKDETNKIINSEEDLDYEEPTLHGLKADFTENQRSMMINQDMRLIDNTQKHEEKILNINDSGIAPNGQQTTKIS